MSRVVLMAAKTYEMFLPILSIRKPKASEAKADTMDILQTYDFLSGGEMGK